MITDILGGGVTGGTDAVSSSKTSASGRGADDKNGFSEALSGFDRESSAQRSDDAHEEHEERASSAQERMANENQSTRSRPIIDIRPESLRRQNLAADGTETLKGKTGVKSDEAVATKHQGDTEERQLTPAEKKLQEALAAAKAVARKSDEQHEKRTAAAEKDGAGKTAKDEVAGEGDKSILGADDAKITDMLTLLHGGEANAAAVHAASQKNAAPGQVQGKRSKDSDERVQDAGVAGTGQGKHLTLVGHGEGEHATAPVDPETAVPGTKQFRFTNARGESQGMEVTGGRERNTVDFKQTSGSAGGENVTVLDSRRFLGLAPNSNGANLTALMSGDSEWSAAMQPSSSLSNAAMQSSTGQVVNTLKLQMNPFDLGQVTATLRLHGDELNVHLTVETRAAYKQLSEDSSGMLDALRAQGFNVDQVTISIAPTADSDTANSQQQQGQQAGQMSQQMAEGGRQGHTAGRGQEQATGDGTRTMNDAVSDGTQVSGSGNARSGQLYL